MIGKTHNIWYSGGAEPYAVNRSCVKAKLACRTYTLQKDRSKFSKHSASPTCQLCKSEPEDRLHFLVKCKALEEIRTPFINILRCYLIDIRDRPFNLKGGYVFFFRSEYFFRTT